MGQRRLIPPDARIEADPGSRGLPMPEPEDAPMGKLLGLLQGVTDPANFGPGGGLEAAGGVIGKAAKLSADDASLLHELLGKTIKLGNKVLRLSSGDPAANKVILHTANGERIASPMDGFLKAWKTIGEETPDIFPEGAVISAPGIKAPEAAIGPKGGLSPAKRRLP